MVEGAAATSAPSSASSCACTSATRSARSAGRAAKLLPRPRHTPEPAHLLAVCLLVVVVTSSTLAGRARLAAASSGEGALEPNGRGLQLLGGREAILLEQSERARRSTRARAVTLYRLLRVAALERRAGSVSSARVGARSVALATAVLARDLEESRALRGELDRVRAERASVAALPGTTDVRVAADAAPPAATPGPTFMRPVAGPLITPFGVGRDGATGTWIFRAAATFAARSGEIVRSPATGRVVRVAGSVAGGAAVVLAIPGSAPADSGWTVVVSGLASVAVAPGETVAGGEALGTAPATPAARARIETWHGRNPVDPAAVLRGH